MAISITAQEKAILAKVTIPPRPQALMKIAQQAKQAEPDVHKIANAIAEDAAISAAVLQVVNSAAFHRAKKVESIHQAVMTLGIKRIFPLVKAVALKSALPENDDLKSFWESSSLIASACTLYCELLNKPDLADNAYMLGLFHNAGIPIMLQFFDDYHDVLLQGIELGWHDITELEQNKYHTSHTTIGALLAQQWQLAKPMIEAIYYLHDTQGLFTDGELPKISLFLLAILKLARSSAAGILQGDANNQEWLDIQDDILMFLHLDENQLDDLRAQVEERLSETTAES